MSNVLSCGSKVTCLADSSRRGKQSEMGRHDCAMGHHVQSQRPKDGTPLGGDGRGRYSEQDVFCPTQAKRNLGATARRDDVQ